MSKSINLDFSKFFPTDHSFVAVKARAATGDDFFVNLAFGDGENKVSYFINEYNSKEALKQMQLMMESLEKTMEFVQKATSLPVSKEEDWPLAHLLKMPKQETAKAPSKKKAAAKK